MTMKGWENFVPPGVIRDGRVSTSRNKFNAKKTTLDGITFDSAKEARRWSELRLLEKAGLISMPIRQQAFPLIVNGVLVCRYVCDFVYTDHNTNKQIVEDAKGMKTPIYRLKKKLMKACLQIDIQEV